MREDLKSLSRIARDDGFRAFSAKYYGREVQLDHIMSIETPKGDEAITPWHTDANFPADKMRPADRFTLKFFIYMNDVGAENGAFAYARGTHRIVTVLREGINEGAFPHFWTARFDEMEKQLATPKVAEYVRTRLRPEEIAFFLETAKRTEYGAATPDDMYLKGPAGTLAVFDDRGMHRGGVPVSGNRSVLRYNYIPTPYWREQFTWPRYAINRALTSLLPRELQSHW